MWKLIYITIIIFVVLAVFIWLFRYGIYPAGEGVAYKIDRITKEITFISGPFEELVK